MAATTPADVELIRRCRRGDDRAFDALVLRHRERAMALARQLMDDREAAEDVVQEAFLRAARALPTLQDEAKFAPWLSVIVRRLTVRHRALQPGVRGRPQLLSLEGAGTLVDLPAPEEDEAQAELRERVRASLSQLTRENREVLTRFYLDGLSQAEIAARTGLPVGTVKRRLHDSRNRFRTEWRRMERAERGSEFVRRLRVWYSGEGGNDSEPLLAQLLAQHIALAINKRPRTLAQIADRSEAHPAYVEDLLRQMERLELVHKQRDRYLLDFLAVERADHEEVDHAIRSVGKEMAARLAPDFSELRAAYQRTSQPDRGWSWEQVQWPVVHLFACTWGLWRAAPEASGHAIMVSKALPLRADGKYYYVGATELGGSLGPPLPWRKARAGADGGTAYTGWPTIRKDFLDTMDERDRPVLPVLADGSATLSRLTAALRTPLRDPKEALAKLVEVGYLRRTGARFSPAFPIFLPEEMEVLLPAGERAVAAAARDLLVPAAAHLDDLLTRLGYGRLKDQFPVARAALVMSTLPGSTMRSLVEIGTLPPPPETAPKTWGFFGWLNGKEAIAWGTG